VDRARLEAELLRQEQTNKMQHAATSQETAAPGPRATRSAPGPRANAQQQQQQQQQQRQQVVHMRVCRLLIPCNTLYEVVVDAASNIYVAAAAASVSAAAECAAAAAPWISFRSGSFHQVLNSIYLRLAGRKVQILTLTLPHPPGGVLRPSLCPR
jgi:hypothetical protein